MARIFVIVLFISLVIAERTANSSSPSSSKNSGGFTELRELQRQNRITQQIFANYIERRLFPHRRPQQKVPTIDDILPTSTELPTPSSSRRHGKRDNGDYPLENQDSALFDDFDDKDGDSESLQTVESNQHQYYPDGITADPAENEVDSGTGKRYKIIGSFS